MSGAESALLGSLVSTFGGLLAVCIAKTKCSYRRKEDSCEPSCAFMDAVLEKDHEEIEVHRIKVNDVELLYVARKEG